MLILPNKQYKISEIENISYKVDNYPYLYINMQFFILIMSGPSLQMLVLFLLLSLFHSTAFIGQLENNTLFYF